MTKLGVLLLVSALPTLWALYEVWLRRPSHLLLRLGYSLVVLIPVIGPLAYLWISRMPSVKPEELQVWYRGEGPVKLELIKGKLETVEKPQEQAAPHDVDDRR